MISKNQKNYIVFAQLKIMTFNIVEDKVWDFVRTVKMKYEISELAELITNFVCEENRHRKREWKRYIYYHPGSFRKKKYSDKSL